ncbi:MFS transporter [Streptomyces sp. NPDC054904]|uniref:MFS transporter n=1 Tax=unclassified Streptomyces TaxID=2593676 RepID=UPI002481B800|nr:MFS transporter [Streptomyces sp. Isolate_45]MDA5281420.1 MFS transporter [Streptomyces sp. Isolate_45]
MGAAAVLRDGNVLRWLGAYAASLIGDGIYFLALGWAAAQTAGPGEVGLVMAAGAVPRALLMLGGGVVADRFGPRLVVLSSDAVRCAVILALAAVVALTSPGLWLLVVVALVFGLVDALFMPAVGALPPRIAEPGHLVRVQGLRSLAERVGHTAGPPAAGLAMGLGGPATAFAVAAALFAASLLLLLTVRISPLPGAGAPGDAARDARAGARARGSGSGAWQQLRSGLAYIRRHGLIGPLVLSGALSQLGTSAPLTLGLILLAGERGWGAGGVGWVVGSLGAGAAASALLLTLIPRFPRAGAWQNATLIAGSAGIGALALAPTLTSAVALALVTGLVCGICGGLAVALIQTATDPSYLGRVSSVMAFTAVGLAPLAYPVFGLAAELWGITPVFLAGGALSMAGAAVGTWAPAVRRAELSLT